MHCERYSDMVKIQMTVSVILFSSKLSTQDIYWNQTSRPMERTDAWFLSLSATLIAARHENVFTILGHKIVKIFSGLNNLEAYDSSNW